MIIIVDGYAVNYSQEGKGPVIVMLHGWGDSLKTFDGLATALKRDYTVIRLDLLGFGASDSPEEPFTLDKYAMLVNHFLEKIGVLASVHAFIGHSNGGAIAIRALSSGKLEAEKLVLLASAGIRSEYKGRKKVLRIAAKAAKIPTMLLSQTTQKKLKKRAYKTIGSDLFVAEHLQETFKAIVTDDTLKESSLISKPVLLLYGDKDEATPYIYGEMFKKQMPNAKLVVIEGAGHFLHQENSKEVLEKIREFL